VTDQARIRLAVLDVVAARCCGNEFADIQQRKIALESVALAVGSERDLAP